MSDSPTPHETLIRWGRSVDALSGEAARLGARLDDTLKHAEVSLARAQDRVDGARAKLEPSDEQARRIEEVARASAEAATRTDLLALNFQVEAARLGEDDGGLAKVADEIRTLADRGARGAKEIEELVVHLVDDLKEVRTAWEAAHTDLDDARQQLARARYSTEDATRALAEARETAAELAAGVRGVVRIGDPDAPEDALQLAAAAEVRATTLERLTSAIAGRLHKTHQELKGQADRGAIAVGLASEVLVRLNDQFALVNEAEILSNRARQLAISADLAATRSEDPALSLFAEEARRLGEQAEAMSSSAKGRLEETRRRLSPDVAEGRERARALHALAEELGEVLERLGDDVGGEPLDQAAREDQAAARRLAEARARWQRADG